MLAARTAHEWAHLVDAAGWVPRVVPDEEWRARRDVLGAALKAVVRAAPPAVRSETAADLHALAAEQPLGRALVRVLVSRLPDYRANLIARHLLAPEERETYVRQNVRPLFREYAPEQLWRRLTRLLYEAQYLRFSAIADPRSYLLDTTWLRDDFLATRILREEDLDLLLSAAAALCQCHDVDGSRFVPGALPGVPWRTA